MKLFLLALLLAGPVSLAAQTQHIAKLRYSFAENGGIVTDTTGTDADTLRGQTIPLNALITKAFAVVTDSLDSLHSDSATIALKVDTTTVKLAQIIGGWLPAEAVYVADSSLAAAGTTGKPKKLAQRGKVQMIVTKWPLTKGIVDFFVYYVVN